MKEVYRHIKESGGFAFDLECTDSEGRPTTNPLIARPILLSVASGGRKPIAKCFDWNDETQRFINWLLRQPDLVAVAHYANYDVPVLHWCGAVDVHDIQATLSDTRILCWMYDEEDDLRLKPLVLKHLGYKMTEFKDVAESTFNLQAAELKKHLKLLDRSFKRRFNEERQKLSGVKKVDRERIVAENEALQERLDVMKEQKRREILTKLAEAEAMSLRLMKRYAADDAKQTWRLYKKMLSWVRREHLLRWLGIEQTNHKLSIIMSIDGALFDHEEAEKVLEFVDPIMEEFEGNCHNLAKQEYKVGSQIETARVLYQDLGIKPPPGTPRGKQKALLGKPYGFSTKKEVLERIRHPIAQAILDYRSVAILRSNFLIGLSAQAKNDPLGKSRVHVTFNSTGTVTGRFSSKTET